jgi:pimeloyl-ACP methyl ester carboxylesterase
MSALNHTVPNAMPTVVLVHGAFADGASWSGVIRGLQAAGLTAIAPANPLRGIEVDSAYIAAVVNAIPGPVLLVGHSYGGAVITNAAAHASNVIGLVYVAAFVPDAGESLQEVGAGFPEAPLFAALCPATVPVANTIDSEVELRIDPTAYPAIFAPDLPAAETAVLAAAQRSLAAAAFGAPSHAAAWKTLPSWYAVATQDQAIHPDEQRFFAKRAGSVAVEIDASHSVAASQSTAIADLILPAARTVS